MIILCNHSIKSEYFCTFKSCQCFICPTCQKDHDHPEDPKHKLTFKQAHQISLNTLSKRIDSVQYELDNLNEYINGIELEKQSNENLKTLAKLKSAIKRSFKKFFIRVENEFVKQIKENLDLQTLKTIDIQNDLAQILNKLNDLFLNLNNKNNKELGLFIQTSWNIDFQTEIQKHSQQFKELQLLKNEIDSTSLHETTKNLEFLTENILNEGLNLILASKKTVIHTELLQVKTNEKLNYKMTDYFESKSTSNFLIDISNKHSALHLIELGLPAKFKSLQINKNLEIPFNYAPLIIPNGNFYLLGGFSKIEKRCLNQFLQFEVKSSNFIILDNFKKSRKSFTACHANNSIYIIGGFNYEEGFLKDCEKFDLNEKKWSIIQDLNEPVSDCSVCSFNDKFLIKFGGLTDFKFVSRNFERFHIYTNFWEILKIKQFHNFDFLWLAASAQISHDEIIIVGGYDYQNGGSNQVLVLSVQQEITVHKCQSKLPFRGGFYYQQLIWNNGIIFGIQNYNENIKGKNEESERKLICLEEEFFKGLHG